MMTENYSGLTRIARSTEQEQQDDMMSYLIYIDEVAPRHNKIMRVLLGDRATWQICLNDEEPTFVPAAPNNDLELRLDLFAKSRKSSRTRDYTYTILQYLLSERHNKDTQGYIRSGELKYNLVPSKIPNASTFFYLLGDMEKFQLIEKRIHPKDKRVKGKPNVYYRAIP